MKESNVFISFFCKKAYTWKAWKTCKKQSLQLALIHYATLFNTGNISEDLKFISPESNGIIVLETW
jgi:hypothetical protein